MDFRLTRDLWPREHSSTFRGDGGSCASPRGLRLVSFPQHPLLLSLRDAILFFEPKARDGIKIVQDGISKRFEIAEPHGLTPVGDCELGRIGFGGRGVEPAERDDEGREIPAVQDDDPIGMVDETSAGYLDAHHAASGGV